jgi:hypothetical protein
MQLLMEPPPVRYWPRTAAELAAVMGAGTWASAWQCDEASGDLADSIGSITLTAANTPTYRNPGAIRNRLPDYAVGFDSGTGARFAAASSATYDIDGSTSLALYLCLSPTSLLNRYCFSKEAGGSIAYGIQLEPSSPAGGLYALIADGTTVATALVSANHVDGAFHDFLFCIDRTNQRLQVFSDLGNSSAVDITAIGSLANAGVLRLGAGTSTAFGHTTAYAAVCTGGVDALRAIGATAIANIRRFTGRA